MFQKIRKQNEGFTIIEVLIVLAIAGLIMLIVFLAVPALQRNSRNTQRTNDVGRALGAAQEVINNNNGQLTALNDGGANLRTAIGDTLAYYTIGNVSSGPGTGSVAGDTDRIRIHTAATCNGNAVAAGTTRQLAATFQVETGSGSQARCQSS
jgi:prepilin-type N-terminal cleavage/methylation domain-containing protein